MNSIIRVLRQTLCVPKLEDTSYFSSSRCLASCKEKKRKKKRKKDKRGRKKKHPVKGKVALITGGTGGIGFSMAKLLLACGARGVFLGDLSEKAGRKAICKLSKEFGENKVIFMKTDVSKEDQLKRAFQCTKEYFKGLDIVINNAGIMKDRYWRKTIDINCTALFNGCLLGFRHMGTHKGNKGGVIVNTASVVGFMNFQGSPAYGASKHFVVGVTRNFGHKFYYKQTKVKVMAICPAVTRTGMISNEHAKTGLTLFKGAGKETERHLKAQPSQPPDACGCHLIHLLEHGKNGSLWESEDSEIFQIKFPSRYKMRVKTKKRKGKRGRKRKKRKKRRKGKKGKKCRKRKKGKKCKKRKKRKKSDKCKKRKKGKKKRRKKKGRKCGKGRRRRKGLSCKEICKKYLKKSRKKKKKKSKCD